MPAQPAIPDEIRQYVGLLITEDLDRNRDHIQWLEDHPGEPDREQQRAESERAIELARQAQAFFPAPPEPEDPTEGAGATASR